MTRILLALLALLGLAAQLSPAEARVRAEGGSEIGLVATAAVAQKAAVVGTAALTAKPLRDWRERRCAVVMLQRGADCIPAVMMGIDRARE